MRRVFQGTRRFFSTEGTAEKVITKETKNKDGTSILERINIVHKWNAMSKTKKTVLAVYGACTAGSFFIATYNDGKMELVNRRAQRKGNSMYTTIENDPEKRSADDWIYVRKGCTDHISENAWNSIFFPFLWVTDAMPKLVLLFNPEKRQEPPKPIEQPKADPPKAEPPKPTPTKWMKDSPDDNTPTQKN